MEPLAYTYEASEHCLQCAFNRFGRDENGYVPGNAQDSDMNPVGAVFEPFEDRDMTCGTCNESIYEHESDEPNEEPDDFDYNIDDQD